MRRKWIFILGLLFLLIALISGGYWGARSAIWERYFVSESADYERAKSLLSQGKFEPAATIIFKYKHYLARNDSRGIDWLPLVVQVMIQSGEPQRLARLYEVYPRVIDADESKALVVAGGLIANRRVEAYQQLRDEWREKQHNEAAWFALDADALIVQGKKKEAINLLESRTFQGPDDSLRLIRLAVYYAPDNLEQSWKVLEQALVKDPKNMNIRRYRAQILETLQRPALAQREYLLAIEKASNQPQFYNQLAQFYIRRGQLRLALDTWKKAVPLPESGPERLSLLFWSRMGLPTEVDWQALPEIEGQLVPLIQYLLALPPGQMWDHAAFEALPNHQRYLRTQQETFWLRVAQALLTNQQELALNLLNHSLFTRQSWSPGLLGALRQILIYRRDGVLFPEEPLNAEAFPVFQHTFFKQLNQGVQASAPLSLDFMTFLSGPYAFPAAFLAAGWFEAALTFGRPSVLPPGLPDWVAYAYTQAIRWTEGSLAALHFLNLQSPTQILSLLKGELMLATGSLDAGLLQLEPLMNQASEIGARATYLTALVLMQAERYDEAIAALDKHPLVGQTLMGKELLARIALAQGDVRKAEQLFNQVGDKSIAARQYHFKKALAEGNLPLAQQLVENLLIDFPDNQEWMDQWEKIKKGGL